MEKFLNKFNIYSDLVDNQAMREFFNLLFLSVFCLVTSANTGPSITVEFSDNLKFKSCSYSKVVTIIFCDNNGTQVALRPNQKGHLFGTLFNKKSGKLESFAVKKINEDGQVTFFNAESERMNNRDKAIQEFDTPNEKAMELVEMRNALASAFSQLPESDTSFRPHLEKMLTGLQKEVSQFQNNIFQATRDMWIVDESGKNIGCDRKSSCDIKKCGDNHYVIYDPDSSKFLPISFSKDKKGKAYFGPDNKRVKEVRTLAGAVITYNDGYDNSKLSNYRMAPKNMQKNSTAYFYLQDNSFVGYLDHVLDGCEEEIVSDFKSLTAQAHRERENIDYVHLVDVVNGQINSQYINSQFLPKVACREGDAFYTQAGRVVEQELFAPRSNATISEKKANELFEKAKKMKGMAWDYAEDGCYARAELMVDMFEKEGVSADKAWASGKLSVPSRSDLTWGYHVAPVVYVEGKNGAVEKMVIDPAISDKPLTTKEWLNKMKVNGDNVDQVGFPPSLNTISVGKSSFGIANSNSYMPTAKDTMTKEDRMKHAKYTLSEYEKRLKQ